MDMVFTNYSFYIEEMNWTPFSIAAHHVDKIVSPGHANGPELAKKYVYKIPEVSTQALKGVQLARDLNLDLIMERSVPDPFMSNLLGETIIMFEDSYSQKLNVSPKLTLIAKIDGMSRGGSDITIVIRDRYVKKLYPETQEQTEAKLLATLAVWGAGRGVYYFENLDEKIELNIEDDWEKWYGSMEKKLIEWSETLV
jgi:hypothetical protein